MGNNIIANTTIACLVVNNWTNFFRSSESLQQVQKGKDYSYFAKIRKPDKFVFVGMTGFILHPNINIVVAINAIKYDN